MAVPARTGSVDFACPWGGDFSLTDSGDFAMVVDTPDRPDATIQRITRLILTNPSITGTNGQPTPPGDMFNPQWGAGVRVRVGSNITPDLIDDITRRIRSGLASDPAVMMNPPPVITITQLSSTALAIDVQFYVATGQLVVVPTIPLDLGG